MYNLANSLLSLYKQCKELSKTKVCMYMYVLCAEYRIAGNFRWCKFSYIINFRIFNIRTAQHSDVEHIDIIVQGN